MIVPAREKPVRKSVWCRYRALQVDKGASIHPSIFGALCRNHLALRTPYLAPIRFSATLRGPTPRSLGDRTGFFGVKTIPAASISRSPVQAFSQLP